MLSSIFYFYMYLGTSVERTLETVLGKTENLFFHAIYEHLL